MQRVVGRHLAADGSRSGSIAEFQHDGGRLEPGQLLSAVPPFCCKQSADGVSLRAIPTDDRRRFLADLSAQLRDVPDGAEIEFQIEND